MSRAVVVWLRRTALLMAPLLILVTVLNYVIGASSSAMDFARQRVTESTAIRDQVGVVERVELRKFWGFRIRSGFDGDRVGLYLRVTGTKGSVPVEVSLIEQGGTWLLVSSSVAL